MTNESKQALFPYLHRLYAGLDEQYVREAIAANLALIDDGSVEINTFQTSRDSFFIRTNNVVEDCHYRTWFK